MIGSISKVIKRPIYLFIYGGEPTLYTHLNSFLDSVLAYCTANRINISIDFLTNLSRSEDWFSSFCSRYAKYSNIFKISCSFHNTQTELPLFLRKCIMIKNLNLLGKITFMYNSRKCVMGSFNTAVSILGIEYCEISPLIDCKVNRVESDVGELAYLQKTEDISKLAIHSLFFDKTIKYQTDPYTVSSVSKFELWLNNKTNFLGYKCSVAKDRIIIDWDGNCYRCISEIFSFAKPLFNINTPYNYDNYFTTVADVICPFKKCVFDLEYKRVEVK